MNDLIPDAQARPSQGPLIRVAGVTKSFGGVRALRGVDLQVFPGEVHALLGENGAGKSTLIKILSGVHAHDGGRIEFAGREVAFASPAESRAAGVAVVYQDPVRNGMLWSEWLGKTLNTGNVVFLGGGAGASSSQKFMDGFKAGLKRYPGLKLLDENFIVTNWNPVDGQKAVAGLIAKYPKIDGIASDYGVTTAAAIKAFEQAGLPIPAQATLASNNELNCKYLDYRKQGKAWKYYSLDGTTTLVRVAARRALAAYEGTPNDEPLGMSPYSYINSEINAEPKCDPGLPPDADMSGQLSAASLNELFK